MLSDMKKCYPSYISGLKAWQKFDPNNIQVAAVFRYVTKRSVIADLKNAGILIPDEHGMLTDKQKIQGVEIRKAFVRFRVYTSDASQCETAVWLNKDLQLSFFDYYLSTAKNRDLCFLTGDLEVSAKTNPVKIRGEWDTKASLISSNDKTNFTYRGRFKTKDEDSGYNEAMSVGYETSQKIHNALKWIIRRQGYTRDGVCIVTWESDLKLLPQFYGSSPEIIGAISEQDENDAASKDELFGEEEADTDTGYMTASEFNMALDGYSEGLGNTSRMFVLALDSISPGRLALIYFKELSSSRYLNSIRSWQKSCCWRQEYFNKEKKLCHYEGVGSIHEIAVGVYGTEQNKRLTLRKNSDGKVPMLTAAFDRLRPCILDGSPIPLDIVRTAVMKAFLKAYLGVKFFKLTAFP
jgi:CRISPR-associated protein Csd1